MSGFLGLGVTESGGELFFTPPADTLQPGWFATCQLTAGTPPIASCMAELEAAHTAYLNSLVAASAASQGYVAPSGRGSITLSNVSRPGQPFQVGDRYTLSISGAAPHQPVNVYAEHNGVPATVPTLMGATDSNGNFSVSGQMGSTEIGPWIEQWTVGPITAADALAISFTVSAAPSATGASSGVTTATAPPDSAGPAASFFSGSTFGFPNWMLLLAGGGLLFLGFRHA